MFQGIFKAIHLMFLISCKWYDVNFKILIIFINSILLQAEENVAKIEAALVDMKKILLLTQEVGEGSKTLSQGGLDVSTEKITIESLLNRTEGIVKGIQLDFDLGNNTTADGNQTILDVEVHMFI